MLLGRQIFLAGVFLTLTLCGCSSKPATKAPAATPGDDAAAADAIEGTGAKLAHDGQGNIKSIDFRDVSITDETLADLEGLRTLRAIKLNGTAITDAGLAHLARVPTLEDLDLRGCAIGNQGIEAIAGLSKLRALRLSGRDGKTTVDDDAMVHIAKLTSLKLLALDFLEFAGSAEGFQALRGLTKLQELYVGNTLVDDAALAEITHFSALKKLRVASNRVTAEGMQHLAKLAQLEDIDLSENVLISDEGLAALAGLKHLKKLNLWRVPINDAGVEHLAGLTSLESLNLDNTGLTDEGLIHLSGLTNLTFLHLGSTGVTDEGVVHLKPLTSLVDLKVTRTGVTEAGVTQLQAVLKDTKIQLEYIEGQ